MRLISGPKSIYNLQTNPVYHPFLANHVPEIRRLLPLCVVSVLSLTREIQPMAISYDSEVDALSDLLNCYVVFCLPFNEL